MMYWQSTLDIWHVLDNLHSLQAYAERDYGTVLIEGYKHWIDDAKQWTGT